MNLHQCLEDTGAPQVMRPAKPAAGQWTCDLGDRPLQPVRAKRRAPHLKLRCSNANVNRLFICGGTDPGYKSRRLNSEDRAPKMLHSRTPAPPLRGAAVRVESRGSAARLARRLAEILRDGGVITLREQSAQLGLIRPVSDTNATAPKAPPPTPIAARAVSRAPRRPAAAGIRRAPVGAPGPGGRSFFALDELAAQTPPSRPPLTGARATTLFKTRIRPALPGVTHF